MPADGFDAAAKKIRDLGTSRWQLPKAMDGQYTSSEGVGRDQPKQARRNSVRCWHQPDQPGRSDDVRCSGYTGSGWQRVKPARLTHNGHEPSVRASAPYRTDRVGRTRSAANGEGALLPKLLMFFRYGQADAEKRSRACLAPNLGFIRMATGVRLGNHARAAWR
jgi:hypothetical protein